MRNKIEDMTDIIAQETGVTLYLKTLTGALYFLPRSSQAEGAEKIIPIRI